MKDGPDKIACTRARNPPARPRARPAPARVRRLARHKTPLCMHFFADT